MILTMIDNELIFVLQFHLLVSWFQFLFTCGGFFSKFPELAALQASVG